MDFEMEEFRTWKVSWPWPWIGLFGTLSTMVYDISHRPLPTHQISFKSENVRPCI